LDQVTLDNAYFLKIVRLARIEQTRKTQLVEDFEEVGIHLIDYFDELEQFRLWHFTFREPGSFAIAALTGECWDTKTKKPIEIRQLLLKGSSADAFVEACLQIQKI
jgi:hypothetical protein